MDDMISRFENIRVVLVEPSKKMREEIKGELGRLGFGNIIDSGNLSMVEEAIVNDSADLLIVDTSLPEGNVNDLIYRMRHGKLGPNPFLVVITLVANPMANAVHAAINSGTDDIAIKPFTLDYLSQRVLSLTHTRKRFVVTTDYIGPDRRDKRRGDGKEIPSIIVPNPLRMRVTGQVNEAKLRRAVEAAFARINEEKIERHGYQVGFLATRMMPALRSKQVTDETKADLDRLAFVAQDMAERTRKTAYSFLGEKCLTLVNMVNGIRANPKDADPLDINLISKLATLLHESVDPERNEKKQKAGKKEEDRLLRARAAEEGDDPFFAKDDEEEKEDEAEGEDEAAERAYMAASAG